MNGDGPRRLKEVGIYAGLCYQKPHKLVESSFDVAARRAVEDATSAKRLLQRKLFVSVVDFALTMTDMCMLLNPCGYIIDV